MSDCSPNTKYAYSGEVSIAYQISGEGPFATVVVPGVISHVEYLHEIPGYTQTLQRLSAIGRVVIFDKRGQGLSDRLTGAPSIEERLDDIRAVMDAENIEKAILLGFSEGAAIAILFAATYPQRTQALIPFGGYAKSTSSLDYPYMGSLEEREAKAKTWMNNWGQGIALASLAPQLAQDDQFRDLFAKAERNSCTPRGIEKYFKLNLAIDIRPILSTIHVPTLVLHRRDDIQVPFAAGIHLAESIPGAKLVEAGNGGHLFFVGDVDSYINEIWNFVSIGESQAKPDKIIERVLATVMFTDIVGSTEKLASLGDRKWREILEQHDELSRSAIAEHRGNLVRSTGDGVLAYFDGPGRAIQCACWLNEKVRSLGIDIRSGLHAGEVEIRGEGIDGIAVHVASRVESLAEPGEVLVSKMVTDLVFGSDAFTFTDRGCHDLKGCPGQWNLMQARINNH